MFHGKIHYKWPFSIVMLNYQRVDALNHHGVFLFLSVQLSRMARRQAEIPSPAIYRAPCEWLAAHISGSQRPGWSCDNFQKSQISDVYETFINCVFNIYIYIYVLVLYIYIYKHITYVVLIIYISYYTIYSYYTYKCMYVYNVYFKPKRALVLQLFGVQFGLFMGNVKSGLVNTPLLSNLLPQK